MATPIDGSSPIMNMGLVTSTDRHTAFDSTVVFHEYMHGVTNRLVGGPLNVHALESKQSAGMGEGWGDYIACTIDKTTVVGAWVVDKPGGIRKFPYNSSFPDHFGMLGTGRYTEIHNIGEIWCATLMEMNRRIGSSLGVQLVVDALKLSPANPSFLNMRDSILAALDNKRAAGQISAAAHASTRSGIWGAFAKFGMGSNAQSNGAQLSGIVADFNTPSFAPVPLTSLQGGGDNMNMDDQQTLEALQSLKSELESTDLEAPNIGQLCDKYRQLKPTIEIVLRLVERIPVYGGQMATAMRFLMGIADLACPVPSGGTVGS